MCNAHIHENAYLVFMEASWEHPFVLRHCDGPIREEKTICSRPFDSNEKNRPTFRVDGILVIVGNNDERIFLSNDFLGYLAYST